ncbi:hypothetical protein NDU88_006721 [Pleurodeles waltl]|uniref:Uncharacterized protein n=1 Tax=Pleurodeles waltl TaxID=8319 RepID=A0AAV7TZC0_PLEWA|nr:hypothetical protein NDU88_006721 [Pleurodeles waltl]
MPRTTPKRQGDPEIMRSSPPGVESEGTRLRCAPPRCHVLVETSPPRVVLLCAPAPLVPSTDRRTLAGAPWSLTGHPLTAVPGLKAHPVRGAEQPVCRAREAAELGWAEEEEGEEGQDVTSPQRLGGRSESGVLSPPKHRRLQECGSHE